MLGAIKMIKLITLALCILCFSFSSNAASTKKIDVKCHVELFGGQQTIYLATVKESHLNKLSERLANRKIHTVYSNEKQQVYKVFECVKLENSFSSIQARNLFAKYPR